MAQREQADRIFMQRRLRGERPDLGRATYPMSGSLISFRWLWNRVTRGARGKAEPQILAVFCGQEVIRWVAMVWLADLSRAASAAPIAVAGVRTPAWSG